YVLHQPVAAWEIGLLWRLGGGAWLLYVAWRAAASRGEEILTWAATGLFFYYLLLHGYLQGWYLLSLVPLLPFAAPRLRPAMRVWMISLSAYYALQLPLSCEMAPRWVGFREVVGGLASGLPALITLWRGRRRPLAVPAAGAVG